MTKLTQIREKAQTKGRTMIRTKRLYTRNGKLYIDSYTEYGRVRIATGCEDSRANRKAILESIDELIYKHIRGERKTTSSLKLRDLCDELLDGLKHIKDTSRLAYTSMANIIISGLGNKDIRLFSAQNVGSFFEGRAPKFEKFFNRLIALANEKNPELNLKPLKIKRIRVVEENEEIEPFSLEEMGLILSTLRANSALAQSLNERGKRLAHKDTHEIQNLHTIESESGERLAHKDTHEIQNLHTEEQTNGAVSEINFAGCFVPLRYTSLQAEQTQGAGSLLSVSDQAARADSRKSRSETSQDLLTYLYIAFLTGARTGEILALNWGDIDFENEKIAITKSLNDMGELTTPKTKSSVRHIDMLPPLKEYLLKLNSAYTGKSELAHKERESGEVSPIITAKRKDLRAEFYALLDSLGLKRRVLYNTRHSFASIMLSQGEEPLWVAAMLGHKNLNITYSHYAKFIPQKSRARAVFLNGVLGLNSACTHARPTGANPSGQSLNECFGSTSVTTTKVAPSSRLAQHLNLTHNPRISCSTCVSNSNLESAQIQDLGLAHKERESGENVGNTGVTKNSSILR